MYMGTERRFSYAYADKTQMKWERVRDLLLRHAMPGATIEIFILNKQYLKVKPVTEVKKRDKTKFQPPGCSMEC